MTRFEFFQKGYGMTAVRLGIAPVSMSGWYDVYKTYIEFSVRLNNKSEARKITIAKYECSESKMSRVISWFEDDCLQHDARNYASDILIL